MTFSNLEQQRNYIDSKSYIDTSKHITSIYIPSIRDVINYTTKTTIFYINLKNHIIIII